ARGDGGPVPPERPRRLHAVRRSRALSSHSRDLVTIFANGSAALLGPRPINPLERTDMTDASERRNGPDRRGRPRGGRRTTDQAGYSPLVLVVDRDAHGRDTCEAILAKLRFAVAPVESAEKALSLMAALRPDIVVVRESEA